MTEHDFYQLYDAAMDARAQIAEALKDVDIPNSGLNWVLLRIGDFVNFDACIMGRSTLWGADINVCATPRSEKRDCTVEEIKAATATCIKAIKERTREGRIAELRKQIIEIETGRAK